VYCVDAKINFDDNASFRQKAVFDMGDDSETDQREVEAAKYGLNYIGMDGNIGCMGTRPDPRGVQRGSMRIADVCFHHQ
jgi:succinyl-CoA synthetase beta subunit